MRILVNGTIAVEDLPILMRSVRLCPTEAEVQDMTSAFKNDKIDFHEFVVSVKRFMAPEPAPKRQRAQYFCGRAPQLGPGRAVPSPPQHRGDKLHGRGGAIKKSIRLGGRHAAPKTIG